ncbi:MAG: hypothetical protein ACTSQA_01150 [Candidatus Heimdallarchaeaceae archaeon]
MIELLYVLRDEYCIDSFVLSKKEGTHVLTYRFHKLEKDKEFSFTKTQCYITLEINKPNALSFDILTSSNEKGITIFDVEDRWGMLLNSLPTVPAQIRKKLFTKE